MGHDCRAGKTGQFLHGRAIFSGARHRHAGADVHESSPPGGAGDRRQAPLFFRGVSATPHRHDTGRDGGDRRHCSGSDTTNAGPRWSFWRSPSAKGIETLSDIHYGLFQLNDRLDQTGRSMMLRGVLSVVGAERGALSDSQAFFGGASGWRWSGWRLSSFSTFAAGVALRRVLRASLCSGQAQPVTDRLRIRRQWNLMRLALPLGIVTTLASINLNMPRYFIHARMGEHQARDLFGAGLRHRGDDPGQRLAGALRHPAHVQAVRRRAACGISLAPASNCWHSAALLDWPVSRLRRPWARGCSPLFTAQSMPRTPGFSSC